MAPDTTAQKPAYRTYRGIPVEVIGPVDLGRLIRELESIDNSLLQQHLADKTADYKPPKTSKFLDNTLEMNKVDLLNDQERSGLISFLGRVKSEAPLLHMSFSADPSTAFIDQLMVWIRHEIHPVALLTIGLQPNLGAGCVLRTNNKYFDFSLRENFTKNRDLLMTKLREVSS